MKNIRGYGSVDMDSETTCVEVDGLSLNRSPAQRIMTESGIGVLAIVLFFSNSGVP